MNVSPLGAMMLKSFKIIFQRLSSGNKMKLAFLISSILTGGITTTKAYSLSCQEVRLLSISFIRHHFSYSEFTDELSNRTFSNLIKAWDPSKLYFKKADVEDLKKKYYSKIDDQISAANCAVVDDVANVYSKRFFERLKYVDKIINEKHDFKLDEYMIIDPDELLWAADDKEVNDRWRKRIKFQHLQLKSTLSDDEIRKKLKKRYELAKKRHNELNAEDVYGVFLNAFSGSLDPHSSYYSPSSLDEFRIQTRLSLEGIGAVLRSEDGFTKIQSLVKGGAAFKTGKVKVGDKIVAVAQGDQPPVDVIDMDLSEVVKLIRGKRSTTVKLSIVREGKKGNTKLVVPIVREKIQLEDRAAKGYSYKVTDPKTKKAMKVGVLSLPSFYMDFQGRQQGKKDYKSSSRDLLKELEKLKKEGVESIVVDLRSNGGGSLDEAIKLAGLFIKKGPVVQIKAAGPDSYVQEDRDPAIYYDGPLVVLTNVQSASASEIFAGAIKDYERGVIVGNKSTFGKGTVQNLNDISAKLGAIKVTISKFYTPSGSSTQLKGVESDLVIPSILDEYEIGEKTYDYALPWEKIAEAKRDNFKLVSQHLPELTKLSASRVKKDKDFQETRKDIDEYRKNKEGRVKVSLKEETKEETKEEEGDDEVVDSNKKPDLGKDILLREAVFIAADYKHLLKGEKTRPYTEEKTPEAKSGKTSAQKTPKK
jgi:carboxyl-terminal processing protease